MPSSSPSLGRLTAIGMVGGLFSGLLGVGGGIVMVPALVLLAGVSQREAHALSLGAIIPISVVGAATFGLAGEVNVLTAALLCVGSIVGARIGARKLVGIDELRLKMIFGVFLLLVAIFMSVNP